MLFHRICCTERPCGNLFLCNHLPALVHLQRRLMFEQDGCYWCEIWDHEIAAIYPKTLEGDVAPLQRIDIHSKLSTDIILKSSPQFTPTFIVVSNNKEVGRIEGYPGEDFFWGLIDKILLQIPEYSQKKGV